MPRGRTLPELKLSEEERAQLLVIANSRSLPHGFGSPSQDRARQR